MRSGADRTMRMDTSQMSYTQVSPTSGTSSSRQAICQARFHTFSFSSSWNSRLT